MARMRSLASLVTFGFISASSIPGSPGTRCITAKEIRVIPKTMGIMKKRRLTRYRSIRLIPHLVLGYIPFDKIVHDAGGRRFDGLETFMQRHCAIGDKKKGVRLLFGQYLLEAVQALLPFRSVKGMAGLHKHFIHFPVLEGSEIKFLWALF